MLNLIQRIPLPAETIAEMDAVRQYDRGARYFMLPQYKYFVQKILRKGIRGGRVLDIGTGSGRLAIELAKAKGDFDIVGIDISENMIKQAVENVKEAGVSDRVQLVLATAAALPFPDRSFDLVISYASLHHWRDPVAVFNEAVRVVKENGRIIIRDNKRVYHNLFWIAFIWLVSRFMNRRHRQHWPRAILASYTIPEIKEMLSKTQLRDYRVYSDFIGFDMCIEWPSW